MGTRAWVVACTVMAASASLVRDAHAETTTLKPANLSLSVPAGWQVLTVRGADSLHWESGDAATSFDVSFERVDGRCKEWRADAGTKKQFPAYWPKRARTHLYLQRDDGKLIASGCLAESSAGALIAHLEITAADPAYTPSKADAVRLRDMLAAALAGTVAVATPLDPSAVSGGATVTVPTIDLAVRLPKNAAWLVGTRGEATIARATTAAQEPALTARVFPLAARTCAEWRVDMSTTDGATFDEKPEYLPAIVKAGVFVTGTNGLQVVTCTPTKAGTLGISVEVAGELSEMDTALVRQLIEAIAVGASKHSAPLVAAPTLLDGGATADATIGGVKVPAGAQWRVTNGAVERFDKGAYFSMSAMSRSTCTIRGAKKLPFMPADVDASSELRPWGVTVVKACVQASRTIELTLAYDGAIASSDHALIAALVDAFRAAAKKPKG